MKKAVFYLEPTTKDEIEGYIVRGWENVLESKQLPMEYLQGKPLFVAVKDCIKICDGTTVFSFTKNALFSKADWNNLYSLMLQAGHRLSKILKEQRKPEIVKFEI